VNLVKNPVQLVAIIAVAAVTWGVGAAFMTAAETGLGGLTAGALEVTYPTVFATSTYVTELGVTTELTTLGAATAGAAGGFAGGLVSGLGNGGSAGDVLKSAALGALGGGISAGLTSAGSAVASKLDVQGFAADLVVRAVAGGTDSAVGGGKFLNGAGFAAFSYLLSSQSGNSGSAMTSDLAGKIWTSPNTLLGVAYGAVGYVAGWANYAFGGQAAGPDIIFGNNAIQFTNNPLARLGAITLGNAEVFGGGRFDLAADGNLFEAHERQHTVQAQLLGSLYLPSNVLGGAAGLLFGGKFHASQNWNEIGPQRNPPRPWP
jgi:hypothetical protein